MFDDFTGQWTDDLEAANTPEVSTSTDTTSGGGFWDDPFKGLSGFADKALATYKTLSTIDIAKREADLKGQQQTGNLQLQQQQIAANTKLAQSQLATQGTLAQLQSAAAIAGAQAKAALPQALAMIANPKILILAAVGLGLAWYFKRR